MSAFLGPIHHWLYGKIQLQEAIIARIAAEAEAQGWGTGDKPAADYVKEETRPLDELIDTMNIHGWLQSRIHDAEGRYAQLVSALLHHNDDLLPELEKLAREVGRDRALGADADASAIYRAFEDAFLNGMPCDRVIHGAYWQEADVDPRVYYILRDAMMEGMLEQTGYTLEQEDHTHYVLRPKAA